MHVWRASSLGIRRIAYAISVAVFTNVLPTIADDALSMEPLPAPRGLTLNDSVHYALEHNPQLIALREQHGIAAAGVVIAKTYPFNPIYQGIYQEAHGPNGTVTNSFPQQHQVTLEIELFHQRAYRQQEAFAALSRTDWEIAAQELGFAINAIRAFDAVLYRERKLAVAQEFLRLNQQGADQVKQLMERGSLKSGDLIVSRAEVSDVQSQVIVNQTAVTSARRDYYRALGIVDSAAQPEGTLERLSPIKETTFWLEAANDLRPDLCARRAAVREAEAAIRLQKSNRFGNPSVGPIYATNESQVTFIGAQVQVPIPILNRHDGEIRQAVSQDVQARLTVRQTEVEIWQDVTFAAAKVAESLHLVENYRQEILPSLRKGLEDTQLLFQQGQGGVDILRVLDVRRKLLKAEDGYLDALLAYTTAMADLAQGVGDASVAMGQYESDSHAPINGCAPGSGLQPKHQ
jgi:cobalt-zinc-cadmium efflux system outer membrane protein